MKDNDLFILINFKAADDVMMQAERASTAMAMISFPELSGLSTSKMTSFIGCMWITVAPVPVTSALKYVCQTQDTNCGNLMNNSWDAAFEMQWTVFNVAIVLFKPML